MRMINLTCFLVQKYIYKYWNLQIRQFSFQDAQQSIQSSTSEPGIGLPSFWHPTDFVRNELGSSVFLSKHRKKTTFSRPSLFTEAELGIVGQR